LSDPSQPSEATDRRLAEQREGLRSLRERIGSKLGTTDWLKIDQARIDAFGAATNDLDPMHVDPAWAATHSPYGSTIAFGFLTLSLCTYFVHQVIRFAPAAAGGTVQFGLNYGFDRIRFLAPVPVNSRVRAHFTLLGIEERAPGQTLWKVQMEVEIDGVSKPALVAEWLGLAVERTG
jgi:acyl dehydratase